MFARRIMFEDDPCKRRDWSLNDDGALPEELRPSCRFAWSSPSESNAFIALSSTSSSSGVLGLVKSISAHKHGTVSHDELGTERARGTRFANSRNLFLPKNELRNLGYVLPKKFLTRNFSRGPSFAPFVVFVRTGANFLSRDVFVAFRRGRLFGRKSKIVYLLKITAIDHGFMLFINWEITENNWRKKNKFTFFMNIRLCIWHFLRHNILLFINVCKLSLMAV